MQAHPYRHRRGIALRDMRQVVVRSGGDVVGGPGTDRCALRSDVLLAGLPADQVRHWLHDQHHDPEQLATAAGALTHPCVGPHNDR